jgi:hypothetical protein
MSHYTKLLEIAGIRRPGQKVKVVGGRHYGHVTEIKDINWSEGEVLLTTKQDYDRWFEAGQVCCLEPDYGPMPDLQAARLEKARASRMETIDIAKPSVAPSWIPKPKS